MKGFPIMASRPTLPISFNCLYYRQADKSCAPIAAIVTDTNDSGILSLDTFPPNAYQHEVHRSVRHISDPWLETPTGREHKIKEGAWDFAPVPEAVLKQIEALVRAEVDTPQSLRTNKPGTGGK